MSEPILGIDLGTTFSVVACLDRDGRPKTLVNEEGEMLTPSVVYFDPAGPIVGREAVKAAEFEPRRAAAFAKRDLGDRAFHKPILGREFPPEVLLALVLKKLKSDATLRLGDVQKAVVTVPAYFNEPRRKATQDAGRIAGLDVIDILNEPTAAAIAFGVEQGFLSPQIEASRRERVLVYDLGGGTFDATIMEISGRRFQTIATAGDVYLGGIDWDERLVRHLAEQFQKQTGVDLRQDETALEKLAQNAVDAKRTLTARPEATVLVAFAGRTARIAVTRAEFEAMTADLLDRTRLTVRRLLKDAGLKWTDLTRSLLVGGSTRMPMVQTMLAEESGRTIDRSLSPDEAVAHGAALYAAFLADGDERRLERDSAPVSVRNVSSHHLGVLGLDPETRQKRRKIMIARNTPIPAVFRKTFTTSRDGQKNVVVAVVEGGTDTGEGATPIGKCVVQDLPPDTPRGALVQVTFRYGADGRLDVSAELPAAGRQAQSSIERTSGLGEWEIREWKARISQGLTLDEPVLCDAATEGVEAALFDAGGALEIEEFLEDNAAPAPGRETPAAPSGDEALHNFFNKLREGRRI